MSEADPSVFPDTRWTLVLALHGHASEATPEQALAYLCGIYWRPLYAFARRLGNKPQDAEDLTQSFLASVVERHLFKHADESSGKLRNFLVRSFSNHIYNLHRVRMAEKRGGAYRFVSMDAIHAFENREMASVPASATPEAVYEKQCALAVLEAAMERLREEEAKAGREPFFDAVRSYVEACNDEDGSQLDLATRLGLPYGAVRQSIYRLRIRFRELIRDVVRSTLSRPTDRELADELQSLKLALAQ